MGLYCEVTCLICNYHFKRYLKYLEDPPSYIFKYCSYECYKKSSDYFEDHKEQIRNRIERVWWNPDS